MISAYDTVKDFYGDKVAQRSQVPLINHIDQGLLILDHYKASNDAKAAYCLHPLMQNDHDLQKNHQFVCDQFSPSIVMLVMEYRNIANAYLSGKVIMQAVPSDIKLSPLVQVNTMLIADKVQNRKDFITYHRGTHPNSFVLDIYFDLWLQRLGVTNKKYDILCALIDANFEKVKNEVH